MDMFKEFFNEEFFNKYFNLDTKQKGKWEEKSIKTPNGIIHYRVYVSNTEENTEEDELKLLQLELDKSVEVEDYLKAAELKKKIDNFKENESKVKELRKQLKQAVEKEDYLKAADIKKQISETK